ncbi:MAG: hypothetical protein WCP09_02830 [Candidatus Taylorbacteria bacterium]
MKKRIYIILPVTVFTLLIASVLFTAPSISKAEFSSTPDAGVPLPNGAVNAIVPDTSGGYYIGGAFTDVGGTTRNRLAHILSNGTLDPNFDPNMDSTVSALALSSDGSTLYAGGTFITVGGVTYNRLAAIKTSDGTASTTFNPNVGTVGNAVIALALSSDNMTIYVGGQFLTVGGATYNNLAAIKTSDGTASTTFNPNVGSVVTALALSSDGSKLYTGGYFTTVGVATYNYLAAINTSDGTAISTFNSNMESFVIALVLSSDGSTLYAGGTFITVGGVTCNRLAAIKTSDGTASTTFNPNMGNRVNAVALSSDGSKLYAGGYFTTVGGVTYNRLAAIKTSDGTVVSAFNPDLGNRVMAITLSSDGNKLYAGGLFATVGGSSSYQYLAVFSNPTPPTITTADALSVSSSSLSLNASISSIGSASVTQSGFAYGTTSATLTTVIATTTLGAQSAGNFTQSLTDLIPNTTYYYRAYAVNSAGTSTGVILSTTTLAAVPTVITSTATSLTTTAATLNGEITNTGGVNATIAGFEYGTTGSYGSVVSTSGDYATETFAEGITGLTCNTTYHFRSFATNIAGTASSSDDTFITSVCPTASVPGSSSSSGGSRVSMQTLLALGLL